MRSPERLLVVFIAVFIAVTVAVSAIAQDTADMVTYQGRLTLSGELVNDTCDLQFQVWDSANGGSPIGSLETNLNVLVTNGLFTVLIDFDPDVFAGGNRWFEISVRCPAGSGSYETLSPRQRVTVAPRASALELPAEMWGVVSGSGAVTIENRALSDDSFAVHAIVETLSDSAAALRGENRETNFGGLMGPQGGPGVWGSHDGYGAGVLGTSVHGPGVRATSGDGLAVYASSETGTAMYATSGAGFGASAVTVRQDGDDGGNAILADTTAQTGYGIGVLGRVNNAPDGTGVYGLHEPNGTGAGVVGETTSTSQYAVGVHGLINVANPGAYSAAVHGEHMGTGANGIGTWGSQDGSGWGVYGSTSSGRGVFGHATGTSGSNYGVRGQSDSASGYDFYAGGAGTDYGSSSSIRWKRNIELIDDPLARVVQMRGVFFDWDEAHGGHHDVGMIAEEVGEVLPEIVQYEENGVDAIGMDYGRLTPLLVEAVKALQAENDALRSRLQYMESRLAEIEHAIAAEQE